MPRRKHSKRCAVAACDILIRVPTTPDPPRLLDSQFRSLTISLLAAVALVSYANLSVSAALPSIGQQLGDVALLPWVITVELLAAAVAVLAVGPVIDTRGARSVYRVAILGFVATSLIAAAAPTMLLLVVARVAQGLTAGGVLASSITTIGLSYPDQLRPRAYAANSAVWGVMGIGGPAVAAALISAFGWRSIFTVSVPVGLAAAAIGWNHLPGPRASTEAPEPFDRTGLTMITVVTVGLLMTASATSILEFGWLAVALPAGVAYARHSRKRRDPVVRLEHLWGPRWRYLHTASTLAVAGGTGASAFLPLYLRGARGASESEAAFSVLFLVGGWSTAAFIASKAQERYAPARIALVGAYLLSVMVALAAVVAWLELPVAFLLATFTLAGAGIGTVTTTNYTMLQGRASMAEMGRITSAHQFIRSLGFAYGAAIGGAVLFAVVSRQIGDVEAIRDLLSTSDATLDNAAQGALQDGYVVSIAVTATLTLLGLLASRELVSERQAQSVSAQA